MTAKDMRSGVRPSGLPPGFRPATSWRLVAMAVAGLSFFALFVKLQPPEIRQRMIRGQNDFVQLYAAARLSGSAAMYSREENARIQQEVAGFRSESMLRHSRLPFYSCLLRPLAWLPYRAAYYTFEAISLSCFVLFLWMFVPRCPELAAFASFSVPLFATLENGQDTTIVVMLAGLSIYLLRRDLPFWSGLALAFCAIKFHLFSLVPLVVLLQRRWSILKGALTGGALLFALSFVGGGPGWPRAYIDALRDSDLHPNPEYMPNLHKLSAVLSGPTDLAVETILALAVILAVVYVARKTPAYEPAFAFALIGSMLVSFHSYVQDCVVLLLALALILADPPSRPARNLTELSASPIPFLCLKFGIPFNLALPAAFVAVLASAVIAARNIGRESPKSHCDPLGLPLRPSSSSYSAPDPTARA